MAPMELPQWLMISEGLLVVAGFIGVLVSGKKADEVDPPPDDVGVSLEAELGLDTSAFHHARKAAVVKGESLSVVNTNGDLGSCSRCNLRRARISSPTTGWVAGVPFLAVRLDRAVQYSGDVSA